MTETIVKKSDHYECIVLNAFSFLFYDYIYKSRLTLFYLDCSFNRLCIFCFTYLFTLLCAKLSCTSISR